MVYSQNASAQISFDSVKIVHRDTTEQIYGITLHQVMKSAAYSDKGWIFLMVSMKDPDNPKIHMRSWQELAFNDGPELFLSPPKHGSASISALPIGCEIKIDVIKAGLSTGVPIEINRLDAGEHRLNVSYEGYYDYHKTFQVFYHSTTYLELSLQAFSNTIFVNTDPIGARIFLNGKLVKKLSPVKIDSVAVGKYKLKANLNGYHRALHSGFLQPSSYTEVELELVKIKRMEALISSMAIPGGGQRLLGRPLMGWVIPVLQAAAIVYTFYAYDDYLDWRHDHEFALDRYGEVDTIHKKKFWSAEAQSAKDRMNKASRRVQLGLYGIGTVYLVNLADVAIFFP